MKRLDEITIADLMPDSISRDEQVSATARAIDPQLRLISEAIDRPLILAAIDDLSGGVLEHLAVQYDVTSWDSGWPIETKRTVLKTAIADKRKKGTRGAVERAIEAVAPIATLTEWWQDTDGEMPPHTFKIDLLQDGSAVDPETQANVIAQVDEAKPVRSHYTFTAIQKGESGFYFAGVLRAISYARVRSSGISIEQMSIDAGVLATLRGMNIRRLLASSHMGDMPEPVVSTQYKYGIMGTDSDSEDLILFDDTESEIMQSTGIQQSYGELIEDAGIDWLLSQNNDLMEVTGIQQSYGEFVEDSGLSWLLNNTNELMETWEPPQNPSCYFTNQGAAATSNFTFRGSTNYYMYDASGQMIPYDVSKTYTIIAKYNIDGNLVTGDFANGIKFQNSSGYLCTVRNWSDGPAYIFRIEYTVS